MELSLLVTQAWDDYGLIDSGHGRKLERYGPYRFIRPEPQAMWTPASTEWVADGEFVPASDEEGGGRWYYERDVPVDGSPMANSSAVPKRTAAAAGTSMRRCRKAGRCRAAR